MIILGFQTGKIDPLIFGKREKSQGSVLLRTLRWKLYRRRKPVISNESITPVYSVFRTPGEPVTDLFV